MDHKRGRFFVLEGIDGSGKATQTKRLVKRLVMEGYDPKSIDFPQYGKNVFADTVGAFLTGEFGDPTRVSPYLACLPYAADRMIAAGTIRDEINRGTILIADRYTSASAGHQGSKIADLKERQRFFEWLRELEYGESGFRLPQPDLTVFLQIDPKVSYELAKTKSARNYVGGEQLDLAEKNFEHQRKTSETFLEIANSEPSWRIINCMNQDNSDILPPEEISELVWKTVSPYLPPLFNNHHNLPRTVSL